jgi:hypothetical protein
MTEPAIRYQILLTPSRNFVAYHFASSNMYGTRTTPRPHLTQTDAPQLSLVSELARNAAETHVRRPRLVFVFNPHTRFPAGHGDGYEHHR